MQSSHHKFVLAVFAVTTSFATLSAHADDTDICKQGYVWREAFRGDRVCVIPETRERARSDNNQAASRLVPGGGETCIQGFVWREAVPADHVCVSPDIRSQARDDNAAASSRVAVAPNPVSPPPVNPTPPITPPQSFWTTLPGIITALAGLLAAAAGLIKAFKGRE